MSSTDISVTCRVNAHVEDAWRMISTSEGISAWFVDAESGVTRDGWQRMFTTFATKLAERT